MTVATVDEALALLEADIERLSPLDSAAVAPPREGAWPVTTAWMVRVKLSGRYVSTTSRGFASEADALAYREAAHEAIGRAT